MNDRRVADAIYFLAMIVALGVMGLSFHACTIAAELRLQTNTLERISQHL